MARRLDIKNLVPRKNGQYRQGYFLASNPQKYIGDPGKIIYRSMWEKRFCTYCDINARVIAWSSENIQVPYLSPIDGTIKSYNVDFYMKVRQEDGSDKQFIVEVKPSKKLIKPELPTTRVNEKRINAHILQMKEYATNMYKFQAAKEWAKARGWEFILVTERFLF